jgi:pimeloyl-ACP methyl ester carboxylesterase
MAFKDNSKPTILCLHGSGCNAAIFEIQTLRLRRELSSAFEFVFIDAPFPSKPGPGILPVFEGGEPYLKWNADESDPSIAPKESVSVIRDAIARQNMTGSPFVGIMGFSQGSRIAAGILLEQQARITFREGELGQSLEKAFLFGVFLNPTWPPMIPYHLEQNEISRLRIPIIGVIGSTDRYRGSSQQLLADVSEEKWLTLMTFAVGHRLPVSGNDITVLAQNISAAYKLAVKGSKRAIRQYDLAAEL